MMVHRTMCLFMPNLSLVLIVHIPGRMARLSWSAWLITSLRTRWFDFGGYLNQGYFEQCIALHRKPVLELQSVTCHIKSIVFAMWQNYYQRRFELSDHILLSCSFCNMWIFGTEACEEVAYQRMSACVLGITDRERLNELKILVLLRLFLLQSFVL